MKTIIKSINCKIHRWHRCKYIGNAMDFVDTNTSTFIARGNALFYTYGIIFWIILGYFLYGVPRVIFLVLKRFLCCLFRVYSLLIVRWLIQTVIISGILFPGKLRYLLLLPCVTLTTTSVTGTKMSRPKCCFIYSVGVLCRLQEYFP